MFFLSQVPQRAQDQVGPDEDVQRLRRAVAYAVLGVLEVREAVWIGQRPPGDRVKLPYTYHTRGSHRFGRVRRWRRHYNRCAAPLRWRLWQNSDRPRRLDYKLIRDDVDRSHDERRRHEELELHV